MILTGLSLGVQSPSVAPRHAGGVFITGLSLLVQTPTVEPRHSGGAFLTGLSLSIANGDKPVGGFVHIINMASGACIVTPSAV